MTGLLDLIEAAPRALAGVLGLGGGASAPPAPAAPAGGPGGSPAPAAGPAGLLSPQSYLHPTRDAILTMLGGAAGRLDQSLQQSDMMRYQRDRYAAIYQQLPTPELKEAFARDPQGVITAITQRDVAPQVLKQGEYNPNGPGGKPVYNPVVGVDASSGKPYAIGQDGRAQTGDSLGGEYKADNGLLYSGRTGGVLATYSTPQKLSVDEVPRAFTTTVSGGPGAPMVAPAGPGPGAPRTPAAGGGLQPVGLRNLNPGNVHSIKGGWAGQTGVDPNGYAVFGSVSDGIHAADTNLAAYGRLHGIDTLRGVVSRWAPQGGGNDTAGYLASVSKLTGLGPDQKIDLTNPQVRQQLLPAIFQVENGRPVNMGQPQGAGAAADSTAPGWSGGPAPKQPRTYVSDGSDGLAPGSRVQVDAKGIKSVLQPADYGPEARRQAFGEFLHDPSYTGYMEAKIALDALSAITSSKSGPRTFAAYDQAARGLNPPGIARPATLKLIENLIGQQPKLQMAISSWANANGTQLPDNIATELKGALMDATRARYGALKPLIDNRNYIAKKYGVDPQEMMVDVPRPEVSMGGGASAAAGSNAPQAAPARPTNAQEFAALRPGAYYVNPADGRTYRKK